VSSTLALDLIWRRLNRPFNLVHAVPALTGYPASDVADLVVLHLAVSAEAEALLAAVPTMMRSLASSTTAEAERSVGHMRGPIMWAETLTARANTFGADDVFVCAAPRRDHDISENRALVTALSHIARADRYLGSDAVHYFDESRRRRISANASAARALLRSKQLKNVKIGRFGTRELHKVARGRRANQYREAVDLLHRRIEPLRAAELHTLCDQRTIGEHHALVLVMAAIQRRGFALAPFDVQDGELVAGRLRYRNWRNATVAGNHGVLVDHVLVDTPDGPSPEARNRALSDLEARAGGRPFCLVTSTEEAEMAVDLALSGAPVA